MPSILPLFRMTRLALPAVVLGLAMSGPAAAQQDNNIFGNLFKPPAPVQDNSHGAEASEVAMRLDRMENALRNLTGQIEQLQYRNQQLEAQVKRLQDDVDARAGRGSPVPASAPPPVAAAPLGRPAPTPVATGKRSDIFDPAEEPSAPGAPQPLGSPASASAGLGRPPAGIGAAPIAGQAGGGQGGTQVAALPANAGPRELYDQGQAQLQRQDYAGAEQTFRQIIQAHAGDRIIPDATFMLGESLFLRRNYGDAAASFLEVSTKYPNSVRAPESLLRLGQSLAGLGEKETACATFLEVDRKYPRSPSAIRQAVEREQKRVGC
ncbi:tol-pal system protein YbgF [Xanthobacter agilis]|uniref:Cell division coordinator CpoB n=1 Tax=Xanthobacter agilis TaxID=47492 RepID=A0ABU0L7Z2_XANAG|nr:tol-pal system protein YbgF [Xanthobacter agilis]MDQ0503274.1 tol-pal system protein YbgF [Xanthobacter agilis]